MTNTRFKDHFSSGSDGYAAYRPTYPAALIDELARISPAHEYALDCGCGTGQLSVLLAARFKHVIGTDASAAQIEQASPHDGVAYRVALAENSGLPDASVDLITVAQAAHWLDLEKLYAEVRRVARPHAAIALISYGVLRIDGDIDRIVQRFYHETIGTYWPAERRHVEEGYRNLPFPFREVEPPMLDIEAQWRLDDLLGYVRTWSAVKTAEKMSGRRPVAQLEDELRKEWGNPQTRRRIHWPLSLRVGNTD